LGFDQATGFKAVDSSRVVLIIQADLGEQLVPRP
jgi:hypothetical protein